MLSPMSDPSTDAQLAREEAKQLLAGMRAVFPDGSDDPDPAIALALEPNEDCTLFAARVTKARVDIEMVAVGVRDILGRLKADTVGSAELGALPDAGDSSIRLAIRRPALGNAIFDFDDLQVTSERWGTDIGVEAGVEVAWFTTKPTGPAPAMRVEGFLPLKIDVFEGSGEWTPLSDLIDRAEGSEPPRV
jgi:hypothetical protein